MKREGAKATQRKNRHLAIPAVYCTDVFLAFLAVKRSSPQRRQARQGNAKKNKKAVQETEIVQAAEGD
ncbi:MAG: hypothetical protein JXA89_01060 [Anaerolineae bacterium]|nr:hypothetical protein [Anaerolineae bacterium]